MAYGTFGQRLGCSGSGRAADARQNVSALGQPAGSSCKLNRRCSRPVRESSGRQFLSTRATSDGLRSPTVVTDTSVAAPGSNRGGGSAGAARLNGTPLPAGPEDPTFTEDEEPFFDSLDLEPEQLESRRSSNTSTSTSGSPSGQAPSSPLWPRPPAQLPQPNGRGPTASPPAYPAWPSAAAGAAAFPALNRAGGGGGGGPASLRPPSPAPPADVPAAVLQLYSRSSVSGDLSNTSSSSDVLAPLFDFLQLEPPSALAPGTGANEQRVYKAVSATAPAAPQKSFFGNRQRARVRVVDASELLLPRDEAVRTELLGRTWQDLLQFEERLGLAPSGSSASGTGKEVGAKAPRHAAARQHGGGAAAAEDGGVGVGGQSRLEGAQEAAAAVQQQEGKQGSEVAGGQAAPSLQEVLEFLKLQAAEQLQQRKQEEQLQQQQHQQQQSLVSAGTDFVSASQGAQLLRLVVAQPRWTDLRRLYVARRADFGPEQLTALLVRLSCMRNQHVLKGERQPFRLLWEAVVQHVIFSAPDLTGRQIVAAIRAMATMPYMGRRDTIVPLIEAAVRLLAFGKASVLPLATVRSSEATILNTREIAAAAGARVVGGAAAGAGGGRRGTAGAAAGGSGGQAPALSATAGGGLAAPPGSSPPPLATAAAGSTAVAGAGGMTGPDYSLLAYHLGRLNAFGRPHRVSVRLPKSMCRGLLLGAYTTFGSFRPGDFARLAYGLSLLRVAPPPQWMLAFFIASSRGFPSMSVYELTMLMYGACRLPTKPPQPWIEGCLEAIRGRFAVAAAEGGMDPPGLALVGHALGRMRYQPSPRWLQGFMEGVQAALERREFQPVELSALFRGLAMLGVEPEREVLRELWEASGSAMREGRFSPAQLANLAWALGVLQVRVPRRWYQELEAQMQARHLLLRPYHRRRLLSALHAFGCRGRDLAAWYLRMRISVREMPGYNTRPVRLLEQRARKVRALQLAARWGQRLEERQEAAAAAKAQELEQQGREQQAGLLATGRDPGLEAQAGPEDQAKLRGSAQTHEPVQPQTQVKLRAQATPQGEGTPQPPAKPQEAPKRPARAKRQAAVLAATAEGQVQPQAEPEVREGAKSSAPPQLKAQGKQKLRTKPQAQQVPLESPQQQPKPETPPQQQEVAVAEAAKLKPRVRRTRLSAEQRRKAVQRSWERAWWEVLQTSAR